MPSNDTTSELSRLQFLPITFFGSVMGLCGLAIALIRFETIIAFNLHNAGVYVLYGVTLWFIALTLFYVLKLIRYPQDVFMEFKHPVRMNFFPAYTISLLLLSIGYMDINTPLSAILWYIGAPLHLLFLLKIVSVWFHKDFDIKMINPAWFIPVVGTILVPIAGVVHAPLELSWFFYSIGIIYWIVLFTIVTNRIIFHNPLPAKLLPTLFILIAPPTVGFISYTSLTGGFDNFSRVLFYFGMFTLLQLVTMLDRFRKVPFSISWWAYTFPLDAATLSTILYYKLTGIIFFKYLSGVLLVITSLVIAIVLYRTVCAMLKKEICIPEP
jgi:tellurite resistance protein